MRIGAVVQHHARQRRAIALPVVDAQPVRLIVGHLQRLGQIGRHVAIDVRKDVRRSVMQRVVEIEQPDALSHQYFIGLFALDERADAFVGEDLQQQGMLDAAVDDVHALHAVARSIER